MAWSDSNMTYGVGGLKRQFDEMFPTGDRTTPVLDRMKDGKKVYANHLEWDQETIASAATKAVLEGSAVTPDGSNVTTTLSNYLQDSVSTWSLSTRAAALDYAGRKDEAKRLQAIKLLELRRSIEYNILNATTTGTAPDYTGSAGVCAGVPYFICCKGGFGNGGTTGTAGVALTGTYANAITGNALTTGTTLVEKDVRLVIDAIAQNAGDTGGEYVIVAPFQQIGQVADWAPVSNAIVRVQVANGVIDRRVREVETNLGIMTLCGSNMMTAKNVFFLDMSTIKICFVQNRPPIVHTWVDKPDGKNGQANSLRFSGFFHSIFTVQVTNPARNGFLRLT
jgi:hypothetical protein